jgi:hypothetical protein
MKTHRVEGAVFERRPEGYYRLRIKRGAEADWALALTLLVEDLVYRIETADGALVISLDRKAATATRGSAREDKGSLVVLLASAELKMWQHFVLRILRDGQAVVDHLDAELRGGAKPVDMVIQVENVGPPMSQAEIKRHFGV